MLLRTHADALAFAYRAGQITRADYMEITGVSPATASRDLAVLVEAGVLIPKGKTRSRIYHPVSLEAWSQAKPPENQLPLLPDE